ncbi:MAG: transcriptional repressor [Oscillospiraceae bacterium]
MIHRTQKYSKKREAILEAIRATKEHPSAEWVYSQLKPEYPDLSLGTVYRNLALFREHGDIISVGNFGGQERFDGNVEPHPHFICEHCHRVIDLDLAFSGIEYYPEIERLIGGEVSGGYVLFTGLCDKCVQNRDNTR